jgi:hypothetical protein
MQILRIYPKVYVNVNPKLIFSLNHEDLSSGLQH